MIMIEVLGSLSFGLARDFWGPYGDLEGNP